MPPDTLYHLPADTGAAAKNLWAVLDSLSNATANLHEEPKAWFDEPLSMWIGFLFFGALVFCSGWLIFRTLRRWMYMGTFFIGKKKRSEVAALLNMYFPYYRQLPNEKMQDKFVRRVICFRRLKQFEFQDMEKSNDARYLVSAAAIQLTFGLKSFRMPFFHTIYIINGEYRHFAYATPFQGHVSGGQIYLSWPHFKYGYEQKNDSHNVGLHEMAHALSWQNYYTEDHHDPHFRRHFLGFSAAGRPLFQRMQNGEQNLLGPYAAANYDEFWATSVEVFFEQPGKMKEELPVLYAALCRLLNQDPGAMAGVYQ